jgi:glycosyltransferase involved in cell wall biosynthesis
VPRQINYKDFFAGIQPPIIGFFGALSAWLDYELIAGIAKKRPEWSFVFIGPADSDVNMLDGISNVHLLGKVDYSQLPNYAVWFDVATIPFKISSLTLSVNPLKLVEYLACGLPVVSVDLPEVSKFTDVTYISTDKETFEACIEKALTEDNEHLVKLRKNVAQSFSWDTIAQKFSDLVEPVWISNCSNDEGSEL